MNFAVFQAVWFACVHGAARGTPWLGPVLAAALLPINLRFSAAPRRELALWALSGAVGLVADSALRSTGLLAFPGSDGGSPGPGWALAPVWIVTLWVAFGSLLTSSLSWLSGRRLPLVALSAIGGPLSFWSGSKIGATAVPGGWMGYLALSIEYSVAVPCLMAAAAPPRPRPPEGPRDPREPEPTAPRSGDGPIDRGILNDDSRR